jgi:hypothetical protein
MKTTKQTFYVLLVLLLGITLDNSVQGQTVATPTVFTTLAAGSQTITGASINGPESWFKWTTGDGVTKLNAKIIQQGSVYRNSTAEFYTVLSVDSIKRIFVDSLNNDSTLHLVAGYLNSGDQIYIRFVNVNSACATCFNLHPLVDFEIFSTMANCSPSIPCSYVRNGGFENNTTSVCGGISIEDGVDCWYTYENTSDVYRRNCFPNSFNWNNLGVSTQNTNPPLNAHSPNPNNTIAGQYCQLTPSHLPYSAYNESIQTLLSSPLVAGHTYSLSCWFFNYSGQINNGAYSNPMYYPVVMTIGTSTGIISSNSPNPYLNSLYPFNPSINQLTSFVVSPVNVWTQYTYTFTYSGPPQSSLLVGPNMIINEANGNVNRTDNTKLYVALDDINITEITPLTTTSAVICEGKTATLTASGMNTYVWQPGNTSGASISANPIVTTVYTVTGTYAAGCTKVNTATVTVNPLPNITVSTPSVAICSGGSAALSAYGGISYTWSPCPANCNLNALVVSPSVSTTYTVTGLASGCTNTATAYVQVLNASNSINITGNSIVCPGQNAFLQASGATNYTWSPCTSGCNSATLAPTPSVTTTYTVRGINACGVLSTSTVVVVVQTVYPILPDVLSGPVCPNYSVTLIANGGSPYSYTWTPGNLVGSNVTVTPSVTTTYTVCTTIFQCPSNCATVTASVMPVPQLTITPASFSVCAGTSTNISVSGATSYTWSTGDLGANVVVTPTASTVYTVSGSVHSCPTLTATSTAYVYPALTINSAPNIAVCPGANTALSVVGGTGTYTWSPGGATTASIVVSPTVPTVYTVASAATGCTLTANALINPVACCSVTSAVTFTSTSGLVTGGVYNLNGPLTLSGDLTIDQAVIYMGTNAEILVPTNMRLVIGASHLLGCPQMWKGMRCIGSTGGIEISKNSLIEDAITAIDVSNVSAAQSLGFPNIVHLENATFNKNYTAVKVDNYNTSSKNYPILMINTVFTSRKLITPEHQRINSSLPLTYNWPVTNNANLKGFVTMPDVFNPDVDLQTGNQFSVGTYSTSNMEVPYSNMVSHEGIRVKNVYGSSNSYGFRISGNEPNPYVYNDFYLYNVFDNMHFGVNAENSNLLVAHAVFQNMKQYVSGSGGIFIPIKYYDGGMGINSVGTTANGLGSSQTYLLAVRPVAENSFNKSTNFFINNPYGIKTENIQNIVINYNVFHSNRTYSPNSFPQANSAVGQGEYAVYIKSLDYRAVNVKRNFTANINNAIIFLANATTFMGSLQIQYGGSMNIQSNILKANYGSTINASQSMQQAIAVDNLISASANLFQSGPNSPVIVSNNIIDKAFSGISVTNWNRQRIIDNSNTVTLANDGTNYSQYAIRHSNNLGDNMIGNTVKGFNTSKQRVYAVMASENKGQSVWCNSSDNSYYGTVFTGSQNLTSWKQNVMSKHVQAMRLDNTTIGQQGATGQPINNTWTGSWTGAYKLFVNGMDPGSPAGNSKMYMSSIPSMSESGATPSSVNFKPQPLIPASLFPATGSSGVVCSSMQPANPEPAQFTGYQGNLHSIVKNVYEYGNYLTGNRKNGKLAVYRILLEDSTLLATDTILQNFKIASDAGNIGKFFKVEQYLSEGNYKDAEGRLSAITPVDSVELGLKKLYKIYLHSKTNAYDATDESDLIALANSCPAQMGIGVYQARVLLNSIYDVYFHYESDCGNTDNVAYRQIRNTDDSADTPSDRNFMVYPNPSSGVVYFTASNMGIESYEVTVYDISGKAIFIKEYTDGEKVNSIDLNLSNGIYLMQLTDSSNGEVHKQKFVIQK